MMRRLQKSTHQDVWLVMMKETLANLWKTHQVVMMKKLLKEIPTAEEKDFFAWLLMSMDRDKGQR